MEYSVTIDIEDFINSMDSDEAKQCLEALDDCHNSTMGKYVKEQFNIDVDETEITLKYLKSIESGCSESELMKAILNHVSRWATPAQIMACLSASISR